MKLLNKKKEPCHWWGSFGFDFFGFFDMLDRMLRAFKKMIPAAWLLPYHAVLSWLAAIIYGHPSEKLIVIGVTGTNGKTTTAYLTTKILESSGLPAGCITTALLKIGKREWLNDLKMTMPGRFQLQKLLRQMVRAGCRYAVVETSSQGIVQHRHSGINYDVAIFTNLTPEHIEAHGGFENYKQAKIQLFRHTARGRRKTIEGERIPKIAILNGGDKHARDFAVAGFDQVHFYGQVKELKSEAWRSSFNYQGRKFALNLPGRFNVENALAAITAAECLGLDLDQASRALAGIQQVPGRFEKIEQGQPWTVIVDYAPEPKSLASLYQALKLIPHKRLIHVLGSCGGGRDVARRPILGRLAGQTADLVVVTNEDPYDDDPEVIMEQVAAGARQVGKEQGKSLWVVKDRYQAILKAMQMAKAVDLVLLTGKGSEQAICVAHGKKIPWDERAAARRAIDAVLV